MKRPQRITCVGGNRYIRVKRCVGREPLLGICHHHPIHHRVRHNLLGGQGAVVEAHRTVGGVELLVGGGVSDEQIRRSVLPEYSGCPQRK